MQVTHQIALPGSSDAATVTHRALAWGATAATLHTVACELQPTGAHGVDVRRGVLSSHCLLPTVVRPDASGALNLRVAAVEVAAEAAALDALQSTAAGLNGSDAAVAAGHGAHSHLRHLCHVQQVLSCNCTLLFTCSKSFLTSAGYHAGCLPRGANPQRAVQELHSHVAPPPC